MTANNAVRIVRAARAELAGHGDATRLTVRELVRLVADRRGLPPPAWPVLTPAAPDVLAAVRARLADLDTTGWDVNDVGACYELLSGHAHAAWYTPPEVADAMVRLSVGPQLDRLSDGPEPESVLAVTAVDPACGAGVFLVAALRLISARFAARLYGVPAPVPEAVRLVMPMVAELCVFGMDIDPVAVDLSRAALWMECGGIVPVTWMDGNVVVGDALSAPAMAGTTSR